jgi:hypothetical protein
MDTMSYKPDYGLKLFNGGGGHEIDHFFYNFTLFSLTVLGQGSYSTIVETRYEGEWCALSLDFNQVQLDKILARAPQDITDSIRQEIARDPNSARSIDFAGQIVFAVRARLGQLQVSERESFIPFIATEIL